MHGAGNIWGDSYGLRPLTRAAAPREPECGQKQRQRRHSTERIGSAAALSRTLLSHRYFRSRQNANQANANSVLLAEAFVPAPS
jgi:hypothetical protein